MECHVFLDTMMLLHFRPLEDIDWLGLTGADQVTLVISRITITELDRQKNSNDRSKIRDRAARIQRKLESWLKAAPVELRAGVRLVFFLDHPATQLAAGDLSSMWGDDVLVAAMMAYRDRNPGATIVLVSDDAGPRITATGVGFGLVTPTDDLRLPPELSPSQREVAELRQTVQQLQSALPKLEIRFVGVPAGAPLRISIRPPQPLSEASITARVDEERDRLSWRPMGKPRDRFDEAIYTSLYSPEERKRYERELEHYLGRFADYLRSSWDGFERRRRSFRLKLEVANVGSAPADDVDVHLHFPDGFLIEEIGDDDDGDDSDAPTPPDPPRTPAQLIMDGMQSFQPARLGFMDYGVRPHLPTLPDRYGLDIRRTNSFDVSSVIPRVKQGRVVGIPAMQIEFDSDATVGSFNFGYLLQPQNLPRPIEGELHVQVTVE